MITSLYAQNAGKSAAAAAALLFTSNLIGAKFPASQIAHMAIPQLALTGLSAGASGLIHESLTQNGYSKNKGIELAVRSITAVAFSVLFSKLAKYAKIEQAILASNQHLFQAGSAAAVGSLALQGFLSGIAYVSSKISSKPANEASTEPAPANEEAPANEASTEPATAKEEAPANEASTPSKSDS